MKRFQWEERTLKRSLSKLKDGTHFSPQSKTGPFKYITSKNIKFGYLDLSNVVYISEYEHKKIFQSSPVHYGDILFTKDGANTGNTAINILKEEFSVLSSVAILSGKKDILDNNFLFQLLLSPMAQRKIKSEMAGQAITRLTLSQIGAFAFTFPSLSEQQKIARILTTWDAAITCAQELLENSKQQKKALMQQMLTGRRRLPGFSKPWERIRIKELFADSKRPISWDDEKLYPLLSVKRRSGGVFFRESLFGKNIKTKKLNIVSSNNLLISKMQVVHGAIGLVPKHFDSYYVSDSYLVLSPKNSSKLSMNFIDYYFQQPRIYHLAYLNSYGVHIEKMTFNFESFVKEKIELPSDINEQKAIAEVLTAADALIAQYEVKLAHLQLQKKALMQQLLTGKIRVMPDTPDTSGDASATPA